MLRSLLAVVAVLSGVSLFGQAASYFQNHSTRSWFLKARQDSPAVLFSEGACRETVVPITYASLREGDRVEIRPGMTLKLTFDLRQCRSAALAFEVQDHALSNPHLVRITATGHSTGWPALPFATKCQLWLPNFLPAFTTVKLRRMGPWGGDTFLFTSDAFDAPLRPPGPTDLFEAAVLEGMAAGLGCWQAS